MRAGKIGKHFLPFFTALFVHEINFDGETTAESWRLFWSLWGKKSRKSSNYWEKFSFFTLIHTLCSTENPSTHSIVASSSTTFQNLTIPHLFQLVNHVCIELSCWCRDENTKDGEEEKFRSWARKIKYTEIYLLSFVFFCFSPWLQKTFLLLSVFQDCLRLEASKHYYLCWCAFLLFYAQLFVFCAKFFFTCENFRLGRNLRYYSG